MDSVMDYDSEFHPFSKDELNSDENIFEKRIKELENDSNSQAHSSPSTSKKSSSTRFEDDDVEYYLEEDIEDDEKDVMREIKRNLSFIMQF